MAFSMRSLFAGSSDFGEEGTEDTPPARRELRRQLAPSWRLGLLLGLSIMAACVVFC